MMVIDDPRIIPLIKCVVHARNESLKSNPPRQYHKYIHTNFIDNEEIVGNIKHILHFFGIFEKRQGKRGSKLIRINSRDFKERVLVFCSLFWKITSLWYPLGKEVSESRKHISDFIELFGMLDKIIYEDALYTLSATGYFSTKRGSDGGLVLIIPAKLPNKLFERANRNQSSFNSWDDIHSEYDLYKNRNSPLVRFLSLRVENETNKEYSNWDVLRLDKKGSKKRKTIIGYPERGKWQNPDIVGFRINKVESNLLSDIEFLSVEVKFELDRMGISEAESFFKFSNIVYLAVAEEVGAVLQKRDCMRLIAEKGIGLLVLSNHMNLASWFELSSPRFQVQRKAEISSALNSFFPEQKIHIASRLRKNR